MNLSDITPEKDLADYLSANGLTTQIYYDLNRPTAGLPAEFIEIMANGVIQRISSDGRLYKTTLALTINVKLLSGGGKNSKKETSILKKIEKILEENKNYALSRFTMFHGKNLTSNYSYKTINININIT